VFKIHHWWWCWRLCNHHGNSWETWLASIPTYKYHTHKCWYLRTHWWCDCCTAHPRTEELFRNEIGNQRIRQGAGYSHSLPCICGKHPMSLLALCQLLLMLCAYFSVNSSDERITPSHRKWWTLCEPGQNTMNCLTLYEKRSLMCIISSKSLRNSTGEVIFSITANVMGSSLCFLIKCIKCHDAD